MHALVSLLKSKGIAVILDVEKPYDFSWADWIINKGFAEGTKVNIHPCMKSSSLYLRIHLVKENASHYTEQS